MSIPLQQFNFKSFFYTVILLSHNASCLDIQTGKGTAKTTFILSTLVLLLLAQYQTGKALNKEMDNLIALDYATTPLNRAKKLLIGMK
jgi:hypothetical protein